MYYEEFIQQNSLLNTLCHISGVDDTISIVLKFRNNRMAQLLSTASLQTPNRATICGTKGRITVFVFFLNVK